MAASFTGNPLDVTDNPLDTLESRTTNTQDLDDELTFGLSQIVDAGDRVGEDAAITEANRRAGATSDIDEAQYERRTRGFDLSARQKQSGQKSLGLARALNRADRTGSVRRTFTENQATAQQAGGFIESEFFNQDLAEDKAEASAFAAEEQARIAREANKKASGLGLIGQVVGMGASLMLSSEQAKYNRGHESGLLSRLKKVRVNRWNYKGEGDEHIGPFAEEFNREFKLKNKHPGLINVVDALGVTLGAVKELSEKVDSRG